MIKKILITIFLIGFTFAQSKVLIQDKEIILNISEDEINKQFDYKYHTKNIDTIFKRVFEN